MKEKNTTSKKTQPYPRTTLNGRKKKPPEKTKKKEKNKKKKGKTISIQVIPRPYRTGNPVIP